MRRSLRTGAALVAASAVLGPVAPVAPVADAAAATPSTYRGTLTSPGSSGGSVTVRVSESGTIRLTARRLQFQCPYPDDDGSGPATLRETVTWRGRTTGSRVDSTATLSGGGNTTIRVVGRFSGRRFTGTIRVRPAEGVSGACSATSRFRTSR